jgi:signal peptidase II
VRGLQKRGALAPLSGIGMTASPPSARIGPTTPSRVLHVALALGVASVVVAVDQVTKSLAVEHLGNRPVHLWGPFGFALGYNSGSAFSLFTGQPVLLGVTAGAAAVVLVVMAWRSNRWGIVVALGLVLGGALSNLLDRALRGHGGAVVDFITLTHWPTFNVADSCVTVGVVLLVALLILQPPRTAQR